MSSAYQIKPWTQVVTPHPDILAGNLDNATYAASLGAVIRQHSKCPTVYRDARDFFAATYLTKELRKLLEDVLKGLRGERGDRVLQLRTPFGGGKTHALISLYHITKHRQELQGFSQLDTLTSQEDSDGGTNDQKTQPDYLGSVSSTDQKMVREDTKAVEYKSQGSSVKRSVLVDIVNGKQPARHYKLTSITNKSQIFQLFEVLQALSDKADDMTISIEVRAHTHHEFDTTWIRNAIEEPLDEMDIQASTQLE